MKVLNVSSFIAPKKFIKEKELLFKRREHEVVYPPSPDGIVSYKYWKLHQKIHWNSEENDPEFDKNLFLKIDEKLQDITLKYCSFLMRGDSVVMDMFATDIFQDITLKSVKFMFLDQSAREAIHEKFYSKMLDISMHPEQYRAYDCVKKLFEPLINFDTYLDEEEKKDFRYMLYFIMLCENILFAPMFHCINYLATLGCCPRICDVNEMVMRDEFIHYCHARELLASLEQKLDKNRAYEISVFFQECVENIIKECCGDYESSDKKFSRDISLLHFRHVCHVFRSVNNLYLSENHKNINELLYGESPSKDFVYQPQLETKLNLMESNSTIYMIEGENFNIVF